VVDFIAIVGEVCRDASGLQAAVVFGSALQTDRPGDLDLALLWAPDLSGEERWRRANRIASAIEHRLAGDDLNVDVKDLRSLPLVLQHRVLQGGKLAYLGNRQAWVRFNSETVPRALDFLPFYRRALRASARKAAGDRS
jgi:hypothetical protein